MNFPGLTPLQERIAMDEMMPFLVAHGELVLTAVVFLEQLGLPLPSMFFLVAAGALIGTGQLSGGWVVSLTIVAALIADSLWYELGRHYGNRVLGWLCKISIEPDTCVRQTEQMYHRHGVRALLLSKFVPGLGTVAPPLAGVFKLSRWRFLIYDGLGAAIWVGVSVGLGHVFSDQLELVAGYAAQFGLTAGIGFAAVILIYILYKFTHRQLLLRRLRGGRISVDELKELMDSGQAPVIVDLRHALDVEAEPHGIPGALWMPPEEFLERHGELPRDKDVILYCS
ncbi:MAG: VTT domain-containing protein [SAR324 cluster bacterium]|nr:VTT domain-containing protein [SAR324 cluster bacterium]MCZ6645208.1 VTT domain-containing protein [SAR324 cluster bacterium]MCZ6728930.1 VTT domain-containing protein [SAR324 cluster bacterium]